VASDPITETPRDGPGTVVSRFGTVVHRLVLARARDATAELVPGRLLVLAPHPDDETIACGGLIAAKREAGHDVAIAVATDGSTSHSPRHIAPAELAERRDRELTLATERLGVEGRHVHRLGLADGRLADNAREATEAIAGLLASWRPDQVLVPSRRDWNPDHRALAAIGRAAIGPDPAGGDAGVACFAYPVWFYEPWAWFDPGRPRPTQVGQLVARLVAGAVTVRPVTVDIDGVLARKAHALEAHRSQLVGPADRPDWPVLPETLLRRSLAGRELYFRGFGP
jgi:LmbE family N-acetylglucosaminyl deacetylase